MKAIQIIEPGKIIVTEIPAPADIKPDEALVKIKYVGFCGSDLNTWSGKNPLVKLPVIPGHEIGGVVEKVGSQVPDTVVPGTSCTINPYTACGNCSSCRNGRANACRCNQTLGVQRNGAMCEYIVVPWTKVIPDAAIAPRDFCLVEPVSVGFHAVSRGQVTDLDTVMVLGCGMIGAGAVIRASLRGAKVIAVDMDDDKLALAASLGATHTVNSGRDDLHERVQALTGASGPDVVIEAVGAAATYQAAINEVAFTGRVVCIGYAKSEIALETKYFVQKELDIRGSRNAMPEDFRAVIEYFKRGACPVDKLISGIYAPEQAQDAMEKWQANPGQVFRILTEWNI